MAFFYRTNLHQNPFISSLHLLIVSLYNTLLIAAIIILVAFLPSIIYMKVFRNTEIFNREPWGNMFKAFFWGAFIAIIIGVILSFVLILIIGIGIRRPYEWFMSDSTYGALIAACVVAPLAEEFAKGLGVFMRWKNLTELENGFIYGAAVGLGFAATENLLYESAALFSAGIAAYILTAIMRSTLSAVLHGSSTSVMGYGIARKRLLGKSAVPYYFLAVLMHGFFNFTLTVSILFSGDMQVVVGTVGFFLVIIYVSITYHTVKRKIRELDRRYLYPYGNIAPPPPQQNPGFRYR